MVMTEKQSVKYSVIIACYNCSSTVERAINSVNNKEAEIICINDGSTDGTSTLLHRLAEEGTITLIELDKNYGPGKARNEGIKKASADLIFILDADNYIPDGLITTLHASMIEHNADIAAPGEIHYFGKGRMRNKTHYNMHKNGICDFDTFIKKNGKGMSNFGASGQCLFTKRSWLLAGCYPEEPGIECWILALRQLVSGCKAIVVAGTYYNHMLRDSSLWKRWEKRGYNKLAATAALAECQAIRANTKRNKINT